MSKLPIVAIVGRANVGKSSIFNRLLDRREAIVADEPGTTRDSITARVEASDGAFWAVDTAGLKSPDDDFEFTIQEQITQAAEAADMIVVVVENNVAISDEDRRVAKLALKTQKPVALVINKNDKRTQQPLEWQKLGIKQMTRVSAVHNDGIDELIDLIAKNVSFGDEKPDDVLRVALVGRPNVGKSSIFNVLLAKQQAIVADFAGTTRDTNRKQIKWHKQPVELLDTAGIRRPGKVGRGIEHFSVLRALAAIEASDVCCLVLDANEPATKLDLKIAGMVSDAGKGLIIVVNKWDTIEKDAYTRDQMAQRLQMNMPFVAWAQLIFTSAETTQNVAKLFKMTHEIYLRRKTEIKTSDLNKWLQRAIDHHPPAGLKNKHPKLRYATQTGVNPPQFRFFGSDTKYLHWSYKRFLEREMRQFVDLTGTSVKFYFTDKKEDK